MMKVRDYLLASAFCVLPPTSIVMICDRNYAKPAKEKSPVSIGVLVTFEELGGLTGGFWAVLRKVFYDPGVRATASFYCGIMPMVASHVSTN
jgi:hypothetical protein